MKLVVSRYVVGDMNMLYQALLPTNFLRALCGEGMDIPSR